LIVHSENPGAPSGFSISPQLTDEYGALSPQRLKFARLSAGGNRIRTIGPALVKSLSAVADERCRTDKLDGVIKHRSSRETTMVGRGASLDGGTDGSNPFPSSGESANFGPEREFGGPSI